MVSFKLTIDVKDAIAKLKDLDVHKLMKEELHDGGDQIINDAKEAVHVISGDLKASGHVNKTEHQVHGGFTKDYATLEENREGGKRGGSHAYLEPAVDKNGPIIFKNMQDRIKDALQ